MSFTPSFYIKNQFPIEKFDCSTVIKSINLFLNAFSNLYTYPKGCKASVWSLAIKLKIANCLLSLCRNFPHSKQPQPHPQPQPQFAFVFAQHHTIYVCMYIRYSIYMDFEYFYCRSCFHAWRVPLAELGQVSVLLPSE